MANNHPSGAFFKTAGFFFLVILLLAFFYALLKPSARPRSLTDSRGSAMSGEYHTSGNPDSSGDDELEKIMTVRKASPMQIKPGASDLSTLFFSSSSPFPSDFHKLPAEYFTPQPPETIRKAAGTCSELQKAHQEAVKAWQHSSHDSFAGQSGTERAEK